MTKRWRLATPKLDIHFGWLVFAALLAQIIVVFVGFGELGVIRRFIFPASYVLLLAFVLLNWRRIGFLVIGAGMAMNFSAIAANGGLMPISAAAMERAGEQDKLADLELGDAVPLSKNVLLDESDTNLQWISDRIAWDSPGPFPVFSVGDVIIGVGLAVIVVELFLPIVVQRFSQDRPSLT